MAIEDKVKTYIEILQSPASRISKNEELINSTTSFIEFLCKDQERLKKSLEKLTDSEFSI